MGGLPEERPAKQEHGGQEDIGEIDVHLPRLQPVEGVGEVSALAKQRREPAGQDRVRIFPLEPARGRKEWQAARLLFPWLQTGIVHFVLGELGEAFVLKAQVDVGGRGKAGGILMAGRADGTKVAKELLGKLIKGLPVKEILAEQKLDIQHEYYLSITVDRSSKQPLILFTEAGGIEIEE